MTANERDLRGSDTRRYDGVDVIDELYLDVPDGSFTVVTGPPRSGKSVLFRMLVGLETADAGRILIDGEDIAAQKGTRAARRLRAAELRAVPAHERGAQYRLPDGTRPRLEGGHRRARRLGRLHARHLAPAREDARSALRRGKAARGGRPRPAEGSRRVRLRRPAGRARLQAPRAPDGRSPRAPRGAWQDLPLRHRRLGRGDDARHPHRRARRRGASCRKARRRTSTSRLATRGRWSWSASRGRTSCPDGSRRASLRAGPIELPVEETHVAAPAPRSGAATVGFRPEALRLVDAAAGEEWRATESIVLSTSSCAWSRTSAARSSSTSRRMRARCSRRSSPRAIACRPRSGRR